MVDYQAEYDNVAKVPGYGAIVAGWQARAAQFRDARPRGEMGIAYGAGERQKLDFYAAGQQGPVVLFVHGGYWQKLHRDDFSHFAAGLLARGVSVAMPSYDLCPQVTMGEIVAQVRAAAALVARRSGRTMLAMGHSAGGHLAAMLLATDWPALGLPRGTVHGALSVSGLFDLAPLLQTTIGDALRMDVQTARDLSPMLMAAPGLPIHAMVGGDEGAEYARQSAGIAEAWGGSWSSAPGRNHFTLVEEMARPDSEVTGRAVAMAGG